MPLNPLEITGGLAIGEGVGGAIADTVEPRLQKFKNSQWAAHQDKPLGAGEAAALAAQAYSGAYDGPGDAASTGIDGDRYLALRFLAATAPGSAELLELWRRDKIGPDLVRDGLKKAGLMDEFVDAVMELFTGRLDPAIVATAIQRGIMRDPGFLPVGPPSSVGKVPAFPVSPLDPIAEAKARGIDSDRLFVETALIGNPAAPDQAARGVFRNIIERVDFDRAVAEGRIRNEWGDALFEIFREIPTADTFVQGHLRGWLTEQQMLDGAARHGMSAADVGLLFETHRRPLNPHAITTALARGGKFAPQTGEITDPYEASVHQADLGPEWYDLAIANKYSYPSAFVLRTLAQDGDLGDTQAVNELLLEIGWKPQLATLVAAKWTAPATGTTAAKIDPWVAKADTQLWTAVHKGYVGGAVGQPDAQQSLNLIGVTPTAQADVFARWNEEKRIEALPAA